MFLNYNIPQIFILLSIETFFIVEHVSLRTQEAMDPYTIGICLFLVVFSAIVASFQKNPRAIQGQILTISFVFLFSFFIVHFVNYLGWLIAPENYDFLNPKFANQACILSSSSFVAILIGKIICKKPFKNSEHNREINYIGNVPPWIMMVFLLLFITFTDRRYFSAGGNSAVLNEIGWNPIGAASYNICIAVIVANVITVVINNRDIIRKRLTVKKYLSFYSPSFYILTLIYIVIVLISGDRGPMMDIIISFGFGYVILKKYKPNVFVLTIVGIFAIFVLKYLSFLRGNPDSLSVEKLGVINDRMSSFHEDNLPIIGEMRELSDVVNAYHLVFGFAETNFIIYGIGVIIQLLAIFPGIRYFIMALTGVPPTFYSTDQLATALLGEEYGAGTTCVADAVYNFGFYGSILFFLIVGYFLRKLDLSIYQKGVKLFVLTMAICYFTKAIYLGRSYVFQPVTLIVYTYLILILTKYINKKRQHNAEGIIIN